jgi:glutathione synthase/RimK-type ligase-like ATP-grasp enzyme
MNAMPEPRPLTFLCITTYEKGQEFMRECKREGCRVILLTAEKLRDADWPRESLDDTFYLPADLPLADIVQAVTHLARTHKLDRIVALDEYDMETASTLREHLRVPGMGLTTMRYFRDKLAMRMKALARNVRVPDFVPVVNHDDIRYYLEHVPGPWVLKPRQEASAIGIRKIHAAEELWPVLEQLGDKQSSFLLEKFLPGEVFHVDSVVSEGEVVFANVSKYGQPPMNVAQGGGVFTTYTVPRGSEMDSGLREINRDLIGGAWTCARSGPCRVHSRACRRILLFFGVCGARGWRLHQRDGRGCYRSQSVARVGADRGCRRQRKLSAPPAARGVCRSDPFAGSAGES